MTRGTRIRLLIFVTMAAVGIVYVTTAYLGVFDRALGRQIQVTVDLPGSGGLYEGSSVTYRGVKVGRVVSMEVREEGGLRAELRIEKDAKIPKDSPVYVHNFSAVGEQYLDFEPEDDSGPYLIDGDRITASDDALPVDEGDLLVVLDRFVRSVDKKSLQISVEELGRLFAGTGQDLRRLLNDSQSFVTQAQEHVEETRQLLRTGQVVLRTQREQELEIRSFARDLRSLTADLEAADGDLRKVLRDAPPAARELNRLLRDLSPTIPVLLANATSLGQVAVAHIGAIEELLIVFPAQIATALNTPRDGFAHVNLQLDYSVPPCQRGYRPREQWLDPNDLRDRPLFPARCTEGAPYVMRGVDSAPGGPRNPVDPNRKAPPDVPAGSARATTTYDPYTGAMMGVVDSSGRPMSLGQAGDQSLMGDEAWKWLLIGPAVGR